MSLSNTTVHLCGGKSGSITPLNIYVGFVGEPRSIEVFPAVCLRSLLCLLFIKYLFVNKLCPVSSMGLNVRTDRAW